MVGGPTGSVFTVETAGMPLLNTDAAIPTIRLIIHTGSNLPAIGQLANQVPLRNVIRS